MGTKGLPPAMAAHLARVVRAEIAARYPTSADGKPVAQSVVAKAIGITQPTLSELLGLRGGVGVTALLALRDWLGMPIDEMLGLPPIAGRDSASSVDALRLELMAKMAELEAKVTAASAGPQQTVASGRSAKR
jgi:transcriptional regulator with XRE-family HTH domain